MFVIIQRMKTVTLDKKVSFNNDIDDVEYYDKFIIEHQYLGGDMFTVRVTPWNNDEHDEEFICDHESSFTVDKETLKAIYDEPAKFILKYVIHQDARYVDDEKENLEETAVTDTADVFLKMFNGEDSKFPKGFTAVRYTNKDGETEETIVYSTDGKHKPTPDDMIALDETFGVNNYRLLDKKSAELYIKKKDKELNEEEKSAKRDKKTGISIPILSSFF